MRIALLSAALAGSALVGFGAISWWLIYNAKINLLDAKLGVPLVMAARFQSNRGWERLENVLSEQRGTPEGAIGAAWLLNEPGKTLYRSQQWPSDLNIEAWLRSLPISFRPFGQEEDRSSQNSVDFSPGAPSLIASISSRSPLKRSFTTQKTASGKWRVGAIATPNQRIAIAVNLQNIHQEMATIRTIFMIAIPGVLLLVAGGAWALSGQALHPIRQLTGAIQSVTVRGLDQRVPTQSIDMEFVELIQMFNQMLERLERSFKQSSRFSANAAHELKTPLAILQGELERALHKAEVGSPIQQSLGYLLDEVCRLSEIVRKLLLLSLADAGQLSLHAVDVNLSAMVTEMAEDIGLLAPDLQVQTDIGSGLRVSGDRDLLARVFHNLISNAIKYNRPEGWISIRVYRRAAMVWVTIINASSDIPEGERDRIFDRFYRGDPARSRKVEGTGLGLNLSREIARAHGGDLTLDPTPLGQTSFTLRLL